MENFRSGVEYGMVSYHRCHSLSCQMSSMQMDGQKAVIRCREKSQLSKCSLTEIPIIPEQAMKFLSRTWSPSSSDIFEILSPNSPMASVEDQGRQERSKDEGQEKDLNMVHFDGGKTQTFDQIWTVLASAKSGSAHRKHKLIQATWMNLGHMKAWLRGDFFSGLSKGCRRKRKEELRLHAAQADAALSVARLAAAIAGIVAVSERTPTNPRSVCFGKEGSKCNKKMNTVLASAAALVATVCAEAAEMAGANRAHVASAVKMGLESQTSADLLTLTATAATCLRGAAALKLRADSRSSDRGSRNIVQKGVTLAVCAPSGRVQLRTVSISPKRDKLTLRLGKKHLHGAFATYEEYRILGVAADSREGEAFADGRSFFAVTLSTTGGTVQLLFDNQTRYKVWKSSIEDLLSDHPRLEHAH